MICPDDPETHEGRDRLDRQSLPACAAAKPVDHALSDHARLAGAIESPRGGHGTQPRQRCWGNRPSYLGEGGAENG
jgi:hypothetical protein